MDEGWFRSCVLHSFPDGILVELKEANERL